jgi:hypothetical protein
VAGAESYVIDRDAATFDCDLADVDDGPGLYRWWPWPISMEAWLISIEALPYID